MAGQDNNFHPEGLGSFFGGQSVDNKLGTQAQFYDDEHTDFRSNPSNLTVLPEPREATSGIVTDLVQVMDQITSGAKYALGDAGNLYRVATNGTWSKEGSLGENGSAGLIYRSDVDNLYFAGQTKLGRVFQMASAASINMDWFKNGKSTATTCTKSGGSNTYNVLTAVSESSNNKRSFTSDIEPLYQLGIRIIARGTGNWTLTLHDDANNLLGSVTIANALLTNGVLNYFTFATPIRIQRGDNGTGSALTYHFHVTSTVADGIVATTTASSLADCDMELWANALIATQNGLHPMANFLNMTLIGNGRYLAAYEPLQDSPTTSDFIRHQLTFPPGYEVCGIAQRNLMAVIGCEKRSATGEFQEGALFYWDGTSTTYNDWWPVPEGSPESLFASQNTVSMISNGVLYEIRGSDQPIKIRTFRNSGGVFSGVADSTHSYPNMMTVHNGILHIGYPSSTTNQDLKHGVYTYGVISREYPLSWGYSYTTSNGSKLNNGTNNLRLGMVKSYGSVMFTSWRDDSISPHTYGVDVVDNTSSPAANFSIQPLVFDDERAFSYKNCGYIVCTFDPLPSGVTITIKYKIDNDSDWTYSTTTVATGDQYLVMPVERRFLILTYALDGTTSGTSPTISSFFAWIDPLMRERPVGG